MDPDPTSADEQLAQAAWVRRLAQSILRERSLAEDAAQESALAALKHGPFDTHVEASWLATTVRRLAARIRRAEERRSTRERVAARDEALPSTAELVERAEAHRALVAAVLALDEPYRSTILLRYVEDLPPRAIARRAGVPVATVKTRLARGLERLRRALEREYGDARAWLGLLVPLAHTAHTPPIVLGATLVKTLQISAAVLLALLLGLGILQLERAGRLRAPQAELAARSADPDPAGPALPAASSVQERVGLAPESASGLSAPADVLATLEKLHGRVEDLQGKPIAGARVRVLHSPSNGYEIFDLRLQQEPAELAVAESGAQGRFALDLPCGTIVDLGVHAQGYADERVLARFGEGEVVVRLGACAALHGTVARLDDGAPVAGALVRVSCGREDAIERVVHTDTFGRYQVDELPPGRVGLIVAPEGECLTAWEEHELRPGETFVRDFLVRSGERLRGRVIDARTRAPIAGASVSAFDFTYKTSTSDVHGEFEIAGLAQRQLSLAVRADGYGRLDQRVLDFAAPVELALQPGQRAHGRVLGPEGEPVEGALVAALGLTERGKETRTARTDARGEFELTDLRTDLGHVLLVRAERFGSAFRSFPALDPQAAAVELGDLRLERAAFLEGHALDESGTPQAGVLVTLKPALAEPELQAMAALHGNRAVETDATGRFVFRDLGPGDWVLAAHRTGLLSAEELSLHLAAGELRLGLEVRLGLGLAIEGLVRDTQGRPLHEAWVSVRAEGPARGRGSLATDENGRFSVRGLSAGSYTVEVIGPGSDFQTHDPFEPAQLRHVQAGCAPLDLHLRARTSSIRGRVLDAEGNPLAGAFVWPLTGRGIPPSEFVLSDTEGRFELSVAPGSVTQLMARRGIPLVQSLRTPTQREARAGRVLLDDPEPFAVSPGVDAGREGIELRIPRAP